MAVAFWSTVFAVNIYVGNVLEIQFIKTEVKAWSTMRTSTHCTLLKAHLHSWTVFLCVSVFQTPGRWVGIYHEGDNAKTGILWKIMQANKAHSLLKRQMASALPLNLQYKIPKALQRSFVQQQYLQGQYWETTIYSNHGTSQVHYKGEQL